MRLPSRYVTVPAASIVKSPRTNSTLTEAPGVRVSPFAGAIGDRFDPPPTPAIGWIPILRRSPAKRSMIDWEIPENDTGVAIGTIDSPEPPPLTAAEAVCP